MSKDDQKQIAFEALKEVLDPIQNKDIVTLGMVKNMRACGGIVTFDLEVTSPSPEIQEELETQCRKALLANPAFETVNLKIITGPDEKIPQGSPLQKPNRTHGSIKYALAVASGKGGVGKSTVAVNLAVQLSERGHSVGLIDCDIYGPSVPTMLGTHTEPLMTMSQRLVPVTYRKLKFISVGLLAGEDAPVIWRGPLVTQLTQQFLNQVEWGDLDYMIVDLPPGTGDIHLTLCQSMPLAGALIVTTPQDMTFSIARKGLNMFDRLQVPVVGVVENMSGWACSECGEVSQIFGEQTTEEYCREAGVAFLGRLPLESQVVDGGDKGEPVVISHPESRVSKAMMRVTQSVENRAGRHLRGDETGEKVVPKILGLPSPQEFEVHWSDGPIHKYLAYQLRLNCPCALCVDEWTGEAKLRKESINKDISITSHHQVGNYAVKFEFSDGHNTGIYTFEHLLDISKAPSETLPETFEV